MSTCETIMNRPDMRTINTLAALLMLGVASIAQAQDIILDNGVNCGKFSTTC